MLAALVRFPPSAKAKVQYSDGRIKKEPDTRKLRDVESPGCKKYVIIILATPSMRRSISARYGEKI